MRLPSDGTSMAGMHLNSGPRVSWLLATSRLYSPAPAARRRESFAAALAAQGIKADHTRISRWESGSAYVPDKVVTAYAAALGHPPGRLLTAVTGLRRSLDPAAKDRAFDVPDLPDDRAGRDAMFDRILTGEHDGLDWTRLMIAMESRDHLYLPQQMWVDLCDQLIRELVRSTGYSWLRRYEAARTLVRNPASQRSMVKALGGLVTAPGAQSIEPVICLLAEIADPQANELVVRLLGSPNSAVRRGATWAISNKLAREHFDDAALEQLVDRLPGVVVRRDPLTLRSGAVDILAALPRDQAEAVLARLTVTRASTDLRHQLQTGELMAPDRARRIAAALAHSVERVLTPHQHVEHDEMLARLIREALMHVHRERRHQASVLLALSPYGPTLSAVLLDGLAGHDTAVAARALGLLTYLGAHETHRGQLLTWAAYHPDPWLRARAIESLAHLPTPITNDEQHRLAALAGNDSADVRAAALYTLGRTASPRLGEVAGTAATPEREMAEWWEGLGPAITEERVHRT